MAMKSLFLRTVFPCTLIVLHIFLIAASRSPGQVTATWTGAVSTDYYTTGNWDIGGIDAVPVNDTENTYAVIIPTGAIVDLSADGAFEITDLFLASGRNAERWLGFDIDGARRSVRCRVAYQLLRAFRSGNAGSGRILWKRRPPRGEQYGDGGNRGVELFIDGPERLDVELRQVPIRGDAVRGDRGDRPSTCRRWARLTAGSTTRRETIAHNGSLRRPAGTVDLSGVTTVRGPYQAWGDKLTFEIGSGSVMDLSNLETITTAGYGRTEFVLGDGVELTLNNLVSADHMSIAFFGELFGDVEPDQCRRRSV